MTDCYHHFIKNISWHFQDKIFKLGHKNFVAEHYKENNLGEKSTNHITTTLYIDVNINLLLKNDLTVEWVLTKKQA